MEGAKSPLGSNMPMAGRGLRNGLVVGGVARVAIVLVILMVVDIGIGLDQGFDEVEG